MVVPKDNDSEQEKDYILTGEPEIVKPLTMHLLAMLERFEELENKFDAIIDLLAELRNRRTRGHLANYPKITLYFEQKKIDLTEEHPSPLSAHLSFRWLKYPLEKIRNDEKALTAMAMNIKSKFIKPLFYFDKGKKIGMYNDPDKGFNYVWSEFKDEETAKKVFEQILDLQQKSPDWEYLTMSGSSNAVKAFPEKPDKVLVMGEQIRPPRRRPLARVYFKYAFIVIPPRKKPIYLVDVTNKKDPLV